MGEGALGLPVPRALSRSGRRLGLSSMKFLNEEGLLKRRDARCAQQDRECPAALSLVDRPPSAFRIWLFTGHPPPYSPVLKIFFALPLGVASELHFGEDK